MKVAFLSDLHVDINAQYDVVGEFAGYLREQGAQLAVVAGDISEKTEETLSTIQRIEEQSGVQTVYVPGNHDLWGAQDQGDQVYAIYKTYQNDSHCLSGRDLVLGDLAVVGDAGWYDYSFGNPQFTREEFDAMTYHGRTWQDFFRNQWTKDNQGRCRQMNRELEERIQRHRGKKVLLVTHMLPVEEFTVPEERPDWPYFNAFLGSRELGDLCIRNKVHTSVCGHVHYRKSFSRDGVNWMCRCLNYHTEWLEAHGKSVGEQIRHAAQVREL